MRRARGIVGPGLTAILLSALLVGCSNPAQPVLGRVYGTVTIDGIPTPGVTVTLSSGGDERGRLLTGTDGTYSFIGSLRAGGYRVSISGFPADASFPETFHAFEVTSTFEIEFNFAGTTT